METQEWQSFPLNPEIVKAGAKPWFNDAYLKDEMLWLKPYRVPTIVSFDLRTHETKYFTKWLEAIAPHIKEDGLLFGSGIMVGNEMIFPFLQGNKIISFNMKTEKSQVYHIGNEEDICRRMKFDGASFWLYTQNGDLLQWNRENNELLRYKDIFGKRITDAALCCGKGALWIFAFGTDDYIRMDIATGQMEIKRAYLEGKYNIPAPYPVICSDYIYIYPNNTEVTVKISMVTGEIGIIFVKQSEQDYRDFCARYVKEYESENGRLDTGSILFEDSDYMLGGLLSMAGNDEIKARKGIQPTKIGQEIYRHMADC